jgi:hypothetical protein
MKTRIFLIPAFALAAMTVSGCGQGGERPIGGQGPPASINEKANLSNPLNVVGGKGKSRLADSQSTTSRRLGR